MHLKNPFMLIIILFAAFLISVFYIYKFLIQPAGAIYLQQDENGRYGSSDFYVVSVVAEDLKMPFFGTAFHINYDPATYKYDHFSLGDYFTPQEDPLVLVNGTEGLKPDKNTNAGIAEIIVGISLKRGQISYKSEGILLKLYFKKTSTNTTFNKFAEKKPIPDGFYFSNAVFSTFDKERKDLKNITFYP